MGKKRIKIKKIEMLKADYDIDEIQRDKDRGKLT